MELKNMKKNRDITQAPEIDANPTVDSDDWESVSNEIFVRQPYTWLLPSAALSSKVNFKNKQSHPSIFTTLWNQKNMR